MKEFLSSRVSSIENKSMTSIGLEFLKLFPEHPLVQCTIPPGYAYIAPTELTLHDASTLAMTQNDVCYTALLNVEAFEHSQIVGVTPTQES